MSAVAKIRGCRSMVGVSFLIALLACLLIAALDASSASAAFGIKSFAMEVTRDPAGNADIQAGSHPYAVNAKVLFNTSESPETEDEEAEGNVKDMHLELPPGLIGNPQATPQCTQAQFENSHFHLAGGCPAASQVGTATIFALASELTFPVYNLVPPPGAPAEFGFVLIINSVRADARIRSDGSYGLEFNLDDISQALGVTGASLTFWGVPADPRHDHERACAAETVVCHDEAPPTPFLTLPTSCAAPMQMTASIDSWSSPGRLLPDGSVDPGDSAWVRRSAEPESHGQSTAVLTGCASVPFGPQMTLAPTSEEAVSATGFDATIAVDDGGFISSGGVAASPIKRLVLRMPEGFTINPSVANGLEACSRAEYEGEGLTSTRPGGCPDSSKVGEVTFMSPILGERKVEGAVYVARQYENPTNSFVALYVIARDLKSGLFFKMVAPVELDGRSGQVTINVDELPQLPLNELAIQFWGGPRAALATPSSCGSYVATAELFSWARPGSAAISSIPVAIAAGPNGGPCPSSAARSAFSPRVVTETANPNAAAYTPLAMRIARTDLEPPITTFATEFPPGLLANLRGISRCSDGAIEAARTMSAAASSASPPCPASSRIGTTKVGAGVGSVLSYIPGGVYLAGPYQGSPFSVVTVVPVRLGPFDLGTIVLRFLLHLDFESAQIALLPDPAATIPQILNGIPTRIRDIDLNLDRERFLVNPTSCEPSSIVTSLSSGSLRATSSARFQAANCLSLPLAPRISLTLANGSGHGAHPTIRASVRMNPGSVNVAGAKIALPASEQLDPSHLRSLCGKGRASEDRCPANSRYGSVRVYSPLLEAPLVGPINLVNAKGLLPDVVARLEGESLNVKVQGAVGYAHGRLTVNFTSLPDVPLSRFEVVMPGGRRGILVNNTNLCQAHPIVNARILAQNGRTIERRSSVHVHCQAGRKG